MPARKLDKSQWAAFFDKVSKALEGTHAEVEAIALDLGDQPLTATWLPLQGIVYDHRDDLIEILLNGVDHLIHNPRDVTVDMNVGGDLASIEIVDADDLRQILRVRDPLMLPAPG